MVGSGKSSGPRQGYRDSRGRKLKALDIDHEFSFACDQCGHCCRGSDIALNPYDILKISDYYDIAVAEFLGEFTRWAVASPSGMPLVFLKTTPGCPFINSEDLCNVYQVRPFLCRSYPVIRIVTYNPSTDEVKIKYSLEKNCSTIKIKKSQTIRQWLTEQCGETYLRESLRWSEFKVRLVGSEYPKEDRVFHRLFYDTVYASELPADVEKAMGISRASSPEERFRAMLKFASGLDWTRFTEETRANGGLFRMERSAEIAQRNRKTLLPF